MSKQKTTVTVEIEIEVEFSPDQFTPEFQSDFKRSFFPYDSIREHLEHLARNHALGIDSPIWDSETKSFRIFAEGYGYLDDLGISLSDAEAIGFDFSNEDFLDDELPEAVDA